jgi:predicted RNA binding protein YcfA (HicA-like mRNA interferase family)
LSKIAPVSRQELIRRLRKLGLQGPYSGSGHAYMVKKHVEERVYITIPNPHHGKDIDVGILKQILRAADISRDEWFSVA